MAQLCVNLLPGDGITAEQLQKATVHLKQAKAYFTMNTDGEPVIHNHDGEASTPTDVRLLKNGNTSSAYYALMLPGQTFAADRLMISIHIGNDIYKYLPTNDITTQANTCHELKLKVNKAGVSSIERNVHRMAKPDTGGGDGSRKLRNSGERNSGKPAGRWVCTEDCTGKRRPRQPHQGNDYGGD